MLGGILAAALYEYLFCPDPKLKRRYAEALTRIPFPSKYSEVQESQLTVDRDQVAKEPLFTVMDVERAERREREEREEREREKEMEASGEGLSSV